MAASIKVKRSAVAGRVPATTDLELGEIAINTYDGVAYIKKNVNGTETIVPIGKVDLSQNLQNRYQYTATANQTVFAASYVAPYIDVYLNGVRLLNSVDFTATNGTSITLSSGVTAGSVVDIVGYTSYTANANFEDMTSAHVTTALGFTPYNATNPSNYITVGQARSGISVSGSLTYDSSTGVISYTTPSTTGITEGTNLYYTDARARAAISVTGSGSYDSSTGVITVTGGVTSVNTRTGAITLASSDVGLDSVENKSSATIRGEITSANVTNALGFTPYNATNPNGYITSSASISGNAATATLLANARNIQGVSFNGGTDITVVTAGTGVTVTGTQVSIGQAVDTSSDVTFNNVVVSGNLTVNGTTTTVNSTTLTVDDKNIELGSVATPSDVTADGGGITLRGATDKTFNWINATGYWTASHSISAPRLVSTVAQGTSPLTVSSNTVVTNLNADLLDGYDSSAFALAGHTHSYLTAESDTLATVTARGATTSTAATFNGGITVKDSLSASTTNPGGNFNLFSNLTGFQGLTIAGGVLTAGTDKYVYIGTGTGNHSTSTTTVVISSETAGSYVQLNGDVRIPRLGGSGFVKVSSNGQLAADTNTYALSSHTHSYLTAESDTLATVTARGATTSAVITHGGLAMSTGTNVDQVYSVTDTLTLTTSWQDTSVNAAELASGSYVVQVYANDNAVGGGHWYTYYTGMMSWYASDTNETSSDEIVLHRAGHASTSGALFLRILRTATADTADLKLQIAGNTANTGTSTYTFKFRRLI